MSQEARILSSTPYAVVDETGRLVKASFVVFSDEEGRVRTVVVLKAEPTLEEARTAYETRERRRT